MKKSWNTPKISDISVEQTSFGGKTLAEIDLTYIGEDGLQYSRVWPGASGE